MPSTKELKEQRAGIAKQLSDQRTRIDEEKREWTKEENEAFDKGIDQLNDLDKQIATQQRAEVNLESYLSDDSERARFDEHKKSHSPANIDPNKPLTSHEQCRAFRAWLGGGPGKKYSGFENDAVFARKAGIDTTDKYLELDLHRGFSESGEAFQPPRTIAECRRQAECRSQMSAEQRATLVVGTTTLGGHTVPNEMMRPLEEALLWFGGMRQVATIIQTETGATMPIPTANDTSNVGEIIPEDNAVNEQAPAFGQTSLAAFKYSSKLVPISVELLQDSATNMPAYIGGILGERLGRITNTHFTAGTGTGQPAGITTGATNSAATFSIGTPDWTTLVTGLHTVDIAYRRQNAQFMLHDTILAVIKKTKDTTNQPIFQPSIREGEPDRILGYPYVVNNDMPTTATSRGIVFGALSSYWIREVRGFTLLRLDERYAEFHRVAFLAFLRTDGKLINAGTGPVKYIALAA